MHKEKKRICPECKGIVKPGHTEMVYKLKDIKITVRNVAANICSKCDQSFITGHVAEEVNRLVNRVSEDINSFIKTQPEVSKGHKEVAIAV
ncbi:MAG: YgiT-type zinc finger protein [Thermodesulfovibrionia bacterium]|nr:YgiT-type zinc finger protein [Thermodesulfovibrionia bacterium]